MAIRTILIDDMSGEEEATVSTRRFFSLTGAPLDIDLSDDNYEVLAQFLDDYISKARPVKAEQEAKKRADLANVRIWAKKNGFEVAEKGRVSTEVLAKYDAANADA
jgi:hypothetical protein